jgi:hypothetical protein
MRRTGLGRHGALEHGSEDPLDGLVNLFDVGLVLAVAFLIAGLGLAIDRDGNAVVPRVPGEQGRTRELAPPPAAGPQATGDGQEVGTVYRLPDGRLILVEP